MAPKREFALSWVDHWADVYGQFMPHKTAIVIPAANKEVGLRFAHERGEEIDRSRRGNLCVHPEARFYSKFRRRFSSSTIVPERRMLFSKGLPTYW